MENELNPAPGTDFNFMVDNLEQKKMMADAIKKTVQTLNGQILYANDIGLRISIAADWIGLKAPTVDVKIKEEIVL